MTTSTWNKRIGDPVSLATAVVVVALVYFSASRGTRINLSIEPCSAGTGTPGAKGDTGDCTAVTGPAGPTGATGPAGSTGATGPPAPPAGMPLPTEAPSIRLSLSSWVQGTQRNP